MEIEQGIRKLVDLLNQVPCIETYSSCEGHYNELRQEEANVMFRVENEEDLMQLAFNILASTSPSWHEYNVELNHRFYVLPDDDVMSDNWTLSISPFGPRSFSNQEKREAVDNAIETVEEVVESYLKN